jgi:Fe-S cluster assembly protein SufD
MNPQPESLQASLEQGVQSFDWPGQADWLADLRQRGLDRFRLNGLPGRTVERWKYTRVDQLEQYPLRASIPPVSRPELTQPLIDQVPRVVMVDGACVAIDGEVPEGVNLLTLEQALSQDHPKLEVMLKTLDIDDRATALSALNTASLRQGLCLFVGAEVDAGEVLVQWAASPGGGHHLSNARVCVVLGEGARVRLVEQFESVGGTALTNLVTQVSLARAAQLEHVRLQQEESEAVLVTRTDVSQAEASFYSYSGLDFGGGTVRHDVRARLTGEGASCSLNGASLTRGKSHVDNHLDAEHLAENCSSRQFFRAVLGDRSRVVFNGRVFVAPGADGTDAQQSSAGLLLSPLAEIDSKPELEIYADEVVASHGATVGQIDPDQLFYLQSRGLDRDAARNLLTMAFCRSVIEHLDSRALRETLEARLQACLAAAGVSDD